eukprot:TCALIF_11336-PA protein Name:"Similar to lov-1 Location of vulva defective 1 (Caenorhabditis elegans)" AED:0.02 eAED:0.02 QI:96/0.94/0.83/1/0.71/0.80/36/119/3138
MLKMSYHRRLLGVTCLFVAANIELVQSNLQCYEEKTPGNLFQRIGANIPSEMNHEMCQDGCTALEEPTADIAGITEGHVCICGTLGERTIDDVLQSLDPTYCNLTCPEPNELEQCGGRFGRFTILQDGSAGPSSLNLNFTMDDTPVSSEDWIMTLSEFDFGMGTSDDTLKGQVFIQVGFESMPVPLHTESESVSTFSPPDLKLLELGSHMGTNLLIVTVVDTSGKTTFTKAMTYEYRPPIEPIQVNCPPVAEPNITYSCSFAYKGSGHDPANTNIKIGYVQDDAPPKEISFGGVGSPEYFKFGHPVPFQGDHPGITSKNVQPVVLSNSRVSVVTYIYGVHHYSTSGAFTITAGEANCDGSKKYNPLTGFCEDNLDWDLLETNHILGLEHTCAPNSVFNSIFKMCVKESCAAQSQCKATPDLPSSYVPVGPEQIVDLVGTTKSYTEFDDPLILAAGQCLIVSGEVGVISNYPNAIKKPDLAASDGSVNSDIIMVEAFGLKPDFIDFENICSESNSTIGAYMEVNEKKKENVTRCHDPIEGFAVDYVPLQTVQLEQWAPVLYVASEETITLNVTNTRGNPVHTFVDWNDNETSSNNIDQENMGDQRAFAYTHDYLRNGTYIVNVTSWNLHSESVYGHVKYYNNDTQIIIVQKEVKDWTVHAPDYWIRDNGSYLFGWQYVPFAEPITDLPLLPTDPNLICTWGDGTGASPNDEPIDFNVVRLADPGDPSNRTYVFQHDYDDHGEYNISCLMYNKVSNQTLQKSMTIYNLIMNFTAAPKWVPNGMDENIDEPQEPLGPDKNQLPLDRNVTFVFDYTQGTIEVITFWNRTNGNDTFLGDYNVTDKFNCKEFRVNIPFREEGFYNVTVRAKNELQESEEHTVTFEIVGQVRGMIIDDYQEVTSKEEEKWLYFDFESIGAGTCIHVDFKDGIVQTFGDAMFCAMWRPDVEYVPGVDMINPIEIPHVYYSFGMYNVSAWASNIVTEGAVFDDLMVIVTSAPCRPPDVSIPKNSTSNLAPLEFYRSKSITVGSFAVLNCSDLVSTKKKWEIFEADVNIVTGEEKLTLVDILSVAPDTYDMADLIIPPRTLLYGTYKLRFFSRMWDYGDEDPLWTRKLPFERDAFSYIAITPTPLVVSLVKGSLSYVTRGSKQLLTLTPHLYSYDPDFPQDKEKGMEFRFFCRKANSSEVYPMNTNGTEFSTADPVEIPTKKQPNIRGGCFGTGPNALATTEPILSIKSEVFISFDQTYEIRLEVRKDVRVSVTKLLVHVTEGLPPIMDIFCADPTLCFADELGNIYVNPTTRLAIKAACSIADGSNCDGPLSYQWDVFDENGVVIDYSTMSSHYVSENKGIEVALKQSFFTTVVKNKDQFMMGITATNGYLVSGISKVFFKINKSPTCDDTTLDCGCDVSPNYGISLIDEFTVFCSGWMDPEDRNIDHYTIYSESVTGKRNPLLKIQEFKPDEGETIQLSVGVHRIVVEIVDEWGAKTFYKLTDNVVVDSPGPADIPGLFDQETLEALKGKGDTKTMLMVLQARSQILEDADENLVIENSLLPGLTAPKTEKEKAFSIAEQKGELKIESMQTLIEATGISVTDLSTAEIMASTIEAIVGNAPDEGQHSDIGMELAQKASSAIQQLINEVVEMPIADPDSLTATIESVMATMGRLLSETKKTGALNNDYQAPSEGDGTDQEDGADSGGMCDGISPINLKSAGKSGVIEYETYVDEVEMNIASDPEQQKCSGVIDAARVQEELIGKTVMEVMKKSALKVLQTLVVDEERIIEKGPLTIYSKMIPGPKLSDWHVVGFNEETDPKYQFTKNFCLGDLVNDSTYWNAPHESSVSRFKVITFLVEIGKADSSLTVEYFPEGVDDDSNVTFFLDFERLPTVKNYSFAVTARRLPWNGNGEFRYLYLGNEEIRNRTGRWFLMAMNLTEEVNATELKSRTSIDRSKIHHFTSTFSLRTWTSGCYFYEPKAKAWVADGVKVKKAFYSRTACRSSHLTAFGAGFFVVPQTLDFEFIFAENSFEDNMTIYMAVIVTFTIYIILLIWSKFQDMKDEKHLRSRPLVDNNPKDHYLYEILAFTGQWRESSCDSLVQIVITGDDEQTAVRTLDPGWKDTLRKGCVDSYIMRSPRPLGDLQYVRVWHDNTGRGNYASWYCTAVLIRDVQTNQQWEFLANRWLAVEKDDGQIERLIPVSADEDRRSFNHLFNYTVERGIREHHIWLSVFLRNERNRFTRAQRVTTGMAMVYLGMLVNALWYFSTPEKPIDGWRIGPLILSWTQLLVGLVCNLIALPPILLAIFMFRKSRRRVLRRNRVQLALEDEDEDFDASLPMNGDPNDQDSGNDSDMEDMDQRPNSGSSGAPFHEVAMKDELEDLVQGYDLDPEGDQHSNNAPDPDAEKDFDQGHDVEQDLEEVNARTSNGVTGEPNNESSIRHNSVDIDGNYMESNSEIHPRRTKFHIHWVFKYVSWTLCLLMIFFGVFFLWAFAIQFGNDVTYQWLSSMLVTFFTSVVLLDPFKVVLITMIVACIVKDIDLDDDDVDEDEEMAVVANQSLWYRKGKPLRSHELHPIDEVFLEKQVLQSNFVDKNNFDQIVSSNDWWDWAHSTIVEELRAQPYYNGQTPFGLRGFIGDKVHRIMGYGILRQVRVVPNSCRVDKRIFNITQECAQASAFIDEDHKDYCNAWAESTALTMNLPSCQNEAFKYVDAETLDSLPYNAGMDLYGGGGYVHRLNKGNDRIKEDLLELQQQHWVNNHTRAVFLEFSVYNANVNLFGIGTIVAEFLPGGGIRPYRRFEIVRLLHHHEATGEFILLCEIIFVLYILYYIYEQLILMKRLGKKYLSYWTLADWSIIICAFIAIFFYVSRYLLTNEILNTFQETKGNGYMKLQYVGVIDELYGYSIGLILFVATINFIRLLRFNNRFAMLLLTLKACWDDLTGFFSVFFLVFLAFVQVFYMILHSFMPEFHSITAALETCFTMLLNKFKFGSIRETSLTAAVMFFCFAISCSFILINVMLTIIMEAYEEVRNQLEEQGNKYDILDFLFSKTSQFIGLEALPPKESVLTKDRQGVLTNQEEQDEGTEDEEGADKNVTELPQKVELFLNYINDVYFQGELDTESKHLLKKELGKGEDNDIEPNDQLVYGSNEAPICNRRRIVVG